MRVPDTTEHLIGKVCVCSIGRLAIVTGLEDMPWGTVWAGVGLDGHGLWCSRSPIVISESIEEYYETLDKIKQLGGK